VNPYPPQEPTRYNETTYPGQPSGPPFYGPPPTMPPPQPPRPPMSTGVILAIVFGALAVLCVGGGIVSVLAGDTKPDSGPTAPAAAATTAPPAAATTAAPATSAPPAAPVTATVPNLVGKNAAVAADELKKLGFKNIKFGSVDKEDTFVVLPENWKVAEQSHPAGSTVATDTLFVLGCTKQR
jgi:pyruvate/2-oxoglutarate dehydrogenase complex dihydrolipoamide acyltransferase (E2) component